MYSMLRLFKPKSHITAYKNLQDSGIFQSDISHYRIKGIVTQILYDGSLFKPLTQVLKDIKLSPLLILKIQLLMHHLLQVDDDMQENEDLFQLLLELSAKVRKMISSISNMKKIYLQHEDNGVSCKQLRNENEFIACQDGTTLLLVGVIQPLLELQKRLVFSCDLIYAEEGKEMEINQCWAVLNLLKKFVSLSPQIEAIGRYFSKQYATAMICLIKVMDSDIQMLYKRIRDYASVRMQDYEDLFQQDQFYDLSQEQKIRMKEFRQLIEEIEVINENMPKIYKSTYFMHTLDCHHIEMPNIFATEKNLSLLYHLEKKRILRKSSSISNCEKETRISSKSSDQV